MIYRKEVPTGPLKEWVNCFWMVESPIDYPPTVEKIIPDGFPEMIFHYGDPYRIDISGQWQDQQQDLLAGQLTHYFHLQNTGQKGMFAIKFQPWAIKVLFNLNMASLTDRVIPILGTQLKQILPIKKAATNSSSFEEKIAKVSQFLLSMLPIDRSRSKGQKAVQLILGTRGEVALSTIQGQTKLSERSLERYFKAHIGLSPKFYTRIIRFAHIFSLAQQDQFNWTDITYLKGFYDQSHFIKNFKEFTGEEPSKYGFTEANMANFFLVD